MLECGETPSRTLEIFPTTSWVRAGNGWEEEPCQEVLVGEKKAEEGEEEEDDVILLWWKVFRSVLVLSEVYPRYIGPGRGLKTSGGFCWSL